MRRIRQFNIFILVLFSLITISGCGSSSKRISIAGSTSVQPIAEVLAEAYMKKRPKVVVNVQGGGSSAGIKAAKDGTTEIGTSSRTLKPEEQQGLTIKEIALDGIAVVLNPRNPVQDLSTDQLRKIYSGAISNWSQVGGNNQKIMIINREDGSGTRGAFSEIVMGQTPISSTAIVQGSTGAVRQAVSADPNAIGYISLMSRDSSVKVIGVNGVACTVENIKQKKYALIRPFLFVYKKSISADVGAFINYVLNQGQRVVAENGLVPVK